MNNTIEYTIKINKGDHKSQVICIDVDLEEVESDGLDMVLIDRKYLTHSCNDNEYEVLDRKTTCKQCKS